MVKLIEKEWVAIEFRHLFQPHHVSMRYSHAQFYQNIMNQTHSTGENQNMAVLLAFSHYVLSELFQCT